MLASFTLYPNVICQVECCASTRPTTRQFFRRAVACEQNATSRDRGFFLGRTWASRLLTEVSQSVGTHPKPGCHLANLFPKTRAKPQAIIHASRAMLHALRKRAHVRRNKTEQMRASDQIRFCIAAANPRSCQGALRGSKLSRPNLIWGWERNFRNPIFTKKEK